MSQNSISVSFIQFSSFDFIRSFTMLYILSFIYSVFSSRFIYYQMLTFILVAEATPARPPPPRPPLPSDELIKPAEAQQFEAVLRAPPADNRMAVSIILVNLFNYNNSRG